MWGAPLMCGFHLDTASGQLVGFLVRCAGLALCMSSVHASTSAETTWGIVVTGSAPCREVLWMCHGAS